MPSPPVPASPRLVFLFSGHRVDAPGRVLPRFPPALVPRAGAAIGAALDALGAGPADLALAQDEPRFIAESVRGSAGTEDWPARYAALRPRLAAPPECLPAGTANAFERCNEWLLDTALAHGPERLRFVCLWDGGAGDGPGGTAQLVGAVRRRGAQMIWIDTRQLLAQARGAVP